MFGTGVVQCLPIKGPLQWFRLYILYKTAFTPAEQKPFFIILRMHRSKKTDVWFLRWGKHFAGFATTINGSNGILLDYLAIQSHFRGLGIGTAAMKALIHEYGEQGLFTEIESVYENAPDRPLRERRKRFYLRCGFSPMQVMAEVFGVPMELLGYNCLMDFPAYQAFYRCNYSPWAAEHVLEAVHPEAISKN